jgi:hypothetical protein
MVRTVIPLDEIKENGRSQGGSLYVGMERGFEPKGPIWPGMDGGEHSFSGVGSVG